MGLDLDVTIPAITVFLQGIISFFSPCVLPIIPLYMGYLSGGTLKFDENGKPVYNQKNVIINTLFFIIGVSFAFFLLGLGFSVLGQFFTKNQMIFSRIGGILIILLGLMQLGVFNQPFKGREFKLPIKINVVATNKLTALLMGFTFSFAWTPCVGPALSTVLIMVSSANGAATGLALMGVYTIGFTLPFLFVGIFTTKCLELFKKYNNLVKYTVKIGAVIMILMGLMMFTGTMNQITNYLSNFTTETQTSQSEEPKNSSDIDANENVTEESQVVDSEETEKTDNDLTPALDFEFEDQFGNIHTLEDYAGKVIFLNIWATWCPPCREEMPDIQKLYEDYGMNEQDVIILGITFPSDKNNYTQEGTKQDVIDFLAENEYTYPTLMDMQGKLLIGYGISAFPTTLMINADGDVFGYVPGMMTYEIMESIIEQTVNS